MLKKSIVLMLRHVSRKLAASRLAHLNINADADAKRLLGVVTSCLQDRFTDDEMSMMAKVESRRQTLEASSRPIELVDFGAGTPNANRSAEEMDHGVVRQDTVGIVCKRASKSSFWTRLLFALIREYQPRQCLELGTCMGISASYQVAALQMNGDGILLTLEGAPSLAEIAEEGFTAQGFDMKHVRVLTGRFRDTLPAAIGMLETIDYAFIDGHHDEQATIEYFKILKQHATPNAIFVFDDISWSRGMRRAWETIQDDPDVQLVLSLGMVGICTLGSENAPKYRCRLPIY